MPALRWTRWGAVALPETLQVRIEPLFAERVAAAAPSPTRALGVGELADNLRFFAEPGPRGRPISGLVLSGLPGDRAALDAIGELVAGVRGRAGATVRRVVVHADRAALEALASSALREPIDAVAVAVRSAAPLVVPAELRRAELHVVVPLAPPALDVLPEVIDAVRGANPARIVLTWPFPTRDGGEAPPAATEVAWSIGSARAALQGLPWTLKGLPACTLGELAAELAARVSRASNRWYVDAEHQRDRALLFLPEVVRFAKREPCRFCAFDDRCDGVAEPWLAGGLVGPLTPIR